MKKGVECRENSRIQRQNSSFGGSLVDNEMVDENERFNFFTHLSRSPGRIRQKDVLTGGLDGFSLTRLGGKLL